MISKTQAGFFTKRECMYSKSDNGDMYSLPFGLDYVQKHRNSILWISQY